jgi:hypothetical protein
MKSEIAKDIEQVGKIYPETAMGSEDGTIIVRKGDDALRESINKAILDMPVRINSSLDTSVIDWF